MDEVIGSYGYNTKIVSDLHTGIASWHTIEAGAEKEPISISGKIT
ncbi:hypothetical protein Q7M76_02670 [Candidatus Liberibacter asiaticus]|nr:hypothetical protein [Candidatus Liberibacter asiaticus]MCU7487814.1 hypothetical protein [Candidatus Liberibacter asiaticus]MCU7488844.1 hypothetical protein [Candidatus Liberibacter asiaticus]MDI1493669.1 hypothetical protein [Candidatus Liberibacter asiaticus]WGV39275.1 hypothetical protein P7T06_02675 [Candidatus Liberibacter asiaticus]WLD01880.1 hypothetical protein PY728_02690 [Candidatus Liberibacter asiaticus]